MIEAAVIPTNMAPEFIRWMCRPRGCFVFYFTSPDLYKSGDAAEIVFAIPTGGHYFRLARVSKRTFQFHHSSPGTGTRVASIDFSELPEFEVGKFIFSWSPEEVVFCFGRRGIDKEPMIAKGVPAPFDLRVDPSGRLVWTNASAVIKSSIFVNGQTIMDSTAIQGWKANLEALEVLWTGTSEAGYMFEVLQTNSALAILVTGLETYAKTRLCELESEGVTPNYVAVFEGFSSKAERTTERWTEIQTSAAEAQRSLLSVLVENVRVNFQNYDQLKKVYSLAFGIKFIDFVGSEKIAEFKEYIRYRHRVIHQSPLTASVSIGIPGKEPIFANRKFAEGAQQTFSTFIDGLHAAGLALNAPDTPLPAVDDFTP